jgi:hypothetical protein
MLRVFFVPRKDRQSETILLTTIVQPDLQFRMDAYPVERDKIVIQPNFRGAMELSLSLCRFENDKDAARQLGMDGSALSCKKSGQKPWNVDEVQRVMERGQHLIPLAYLAHQYGHGLVMLETEAERRERALREQVAALQHEKRVLIEALRGSGAP